MDYREREELKDAIIRELHRDTSWTRDIVNELMRELKRELLYEIKHDYSFRRDLVQEILKEIER